MLSRFHMSPTLPMDKWSGGSEFTMALLYFVV